MKKTIIIVLLFLSVPPNVSYTDNPPSIVSVEFVKSIEEPYNHDLNDDKIVDIFDIVKAAKNRTIDFIQEIVKLFGEKIRPN